ncbi:MAG: dihydrofolate reductase [Lachnospiraceae bacterium]|nr:dihydrofolate reductase [Lachnospiraceae bacterium]MBR1649563.1 dihydrofolate reductase [Lachnospiraceae bacterium]
MNIVAAVDNNWAIGNKGELLVSIPNDQKTFRLLTTGKVVVLGRKTLDTFPQKQPLPNRTNIILSRDKNFKVKGAVVVNSVGELMEYLKPYKSEDIYIIGGESIYEQLLPYCDTAHITAIDYEYEADTYLKNLDEDPEWVKTADSDEITYFDLSYSFVKYERVKKLGKQS